MDVRSGNVNEGRFARGAHGQPRRSAMNVTKVERVAKKATVKEA